MKVKKINKNITNYGIGESLLNKTKKILGINLRKDPLFFIKEKENKIKNEFRKFKIQFKTIVLQNIRFKKTLKIEKKGNIKKMPKLKKK